MRVAPGEARITPRAPSDPDHPTGTPATPNAFDAVLPTDAAGYPGPAEDRAPAPEKPADAWQSFEDATRWLHVDIYGWTISGLSQYHVVTSLWRARWPPMTMIKPASSAGTQA